MAEIMGTFARECRWRRWQFLVVILAAAWTLEMSQLHLSLAQSPTPGIPPLPPTPPGFPPLPSNNTIRDRIEAALEQINNLSSSIASSIEGTNSACVLSSDQENTFDTSQMGNILVQCASFTDLDLPLRICGRGEINLYLVSIPSYGVPPNPNCNSTNWPTGCNPGWAAGAAANTNLTALEETSTIPIRTSNPKSCCAGFFCPSGLTCMIPCPSGAYCPFATYDPPSSTCHPYKYTASPKGSGECGGADVWLAIKDSPGMFCGGGQWSGSGKYCPDAITQNECEKGHYCRIGSTVQTKCKFLMGCSKDGLKAGNLKTYGILIVVLLSVSLIVIYTCSGQLMHILERRKSKTRDIAARQAKESVSAVERWKRAKEATKIAGKKAAMLTGDIRRTLSKTMSKVGTSRAASPCPEKREIEEQPLSEDPLDSSADPIDQHGLVDPMVQLKWQVDEELGKREHEFHPHKDPSAAVVESSQDDWTRDLYPVGEPRNVDLYDAVQLSPVVAGGLYKGEGWPASFPKARKTMHTRSQIYKYAYGQIEKEKAKQQSKPTSFLEVVESDEFTETLAGQKRLKIELSFVDLCLVLKGSGKKILSYVTGKLSPSRVTAVMGPSGAGKTTFLNALAGKETGSVITGQVFINGVPGSIQAYKRIIGFVPQDDIVHGSLTVEENLSFSAKYRLPVDTPRQERVLVVERIINRLNLALIRNSLVGTVENRGISGGQRKRVNVGLELVIEPSVLILDEPTSGLDSTSSRLVVQSLRREAALGVNVCLVVHQPSYGLFRMFDDVMFLAVGGYTVYLGPTIEIEAYFASLGFEVPDRTNPPDYYMDVLEGAIVPDNDPSFDLKSLPVLWMCHNGYHIPLELQETADGRKIERDDPLRISYDAPKTFVHEIWDELRIYVLVRLDILETAFSSVQNLTGRRTPGFAAQYFLILRRVIKQRFRDSRLVAQDYIILVLAGVVLGILAGWDDTAVFQQAYMFTLIALAMLIMIASLRTFGSDKLQFWRESSSGVNKLAFFLAKDTMDHFNTVLKPCVFLSMFYFYNNPRASFTSHYIITLALIYCCTGIAYVISIVLKPQPGQLFCVFLPVLATLIVSSKRNGTLGKIESLSYAYWALQAYTIVNAERYTGVWLLLRCETLVKYGYRITAFNRCIAILMAYGLGARVLAFICLIVFNRNRQK